ncbi:MAG: glycosyltransferase family 2 protein [Actinomycetota bacterium]|nr:glycosyltransferase family 2 protein [Actinomycetota bacterium]
MTVVEPDPVIAAEEYARLDAAERGPVQDFLSANPAGAGAPVAVVIPAYNEAPTVAGVIAEIPAAVGELATEVIVVVDGARDSTAQAAGQAGALVCDVPVNRGQGAALRLGYWLARARGADVIVTIDADGQYEAYEIAQLIEPILSGRADFVSGSRRLGTELTTDATRHAGVIVFGALISLLIGQRITDPACGLRAMRSAVTAAVGLEQPQYQASELMISAALHGFALTEVPTTMRDRGQDATQTKKGGNFGYGVRFARAAVHTWWRDRTAARRRERPANTQRS